MHLRTSLFSLLLDHYAPYMFVHTLNKLIILPGNKFQHCPRRADRRTSIIHPHHSSTVYDESSKANHILEAFPVKIAGEGTRQSSANTLNSSFCFFTCYWFVFYSSCFSLFLLVLFFLSLFFVFLVSTSTSTSPTRALINQGDNVIYSLLLLLLKSLILDERYTSLLLIKCKVIPFYHFEFIVAEEREEKEWRGNSS